MERARQSFETNQGIGRIGEAIARAWVDDGTWSISPPTGNEAHIVDFSVMKMNKSAGALCAKMFFIDAKAKPLTYHFNDTGFNDSNYRDYLSLPGRVFVFFTDYALGLVYGNFLDVLGDGFVVEATRFQPAIRFWGVERMEIIGELSPAECTELRAVSCDRFEYPLSWRHAQSQLGLMYGARRTFTELITGAYFPTTIVPPNPNRKKRRAWPCIAGGTR
jgi:hypothetical protein